MATNTAQIKELLSSIQEATPVQLLEHAALLHQKRRAENLTPTEQSELLQLTEAIEKQHIVRMELLVELSRLRGVSWKTVMDQLGVLPFPSHG